MSTEKVLQSMIEKLYAESASHYNFSISPYDNNSYIEGADGQFLGKLTHQHDADSLFNPYGVHGSKYQSLSIFNPYGEYGSKYMPYSVTNQYTSTPPLIYIQGRVIGRLTANKHVPQSFRPDVFLYYVSNRINVYPYFKKQFLEFVDYLD